jgi:hypothetical protein
MMNVIEKAFSVIPQKYSIPKMLIQIILTIARTNAEVRKSANIMTVTTYTIQQAKPRERAVSATKTAYCS